MTKELLPGLGSGALREALQKWQRKYFSAGISHEMWPNAVEHGFEAGWQAALSLSSPIEPPRSGGQWCELASSDGNGGCVYAQPTPQASSEVREAHGPAEQCRQDEHAFNVCGGCGLREEYWERWPECRRAKS